MMDSNQTYIINYLNTAFYFQQNRKVYNKYKRELLKKLPASTLLLWYALQSKYKKFNGKFFYSDKRLAKETGLSTDSIMRGKRLLVKYGKIKIRIGRFEGTSTDYLFVEGSKISQEGSKISQEGSKISQEGSKIRLRASHLATPININKDIINKEEIRFDPEVCEMIKEYTEGKRNDKKKVNINA